MSLDELAATYTADVLRTLRLTSESGVLAVGNAALGVGFVHLVPHAPTAAETCTVNHRPGVRINAGLSPERKGWYVAWGVAKHLLASDGVEHRLAEKLRSLVAAELLMPRDLLAANDHHPREIAHFYAWPDAATMLRMAELDRIATALVVPPGPSGTKQRAYERVRGDDRGLFPTDPVALRHLAANRSIGIERFAVPEEGIGAVVLRMAALFC